MTRKVWLPILIAALATLILVPSVSLWAQTAVDVYLAPRDISIGTAVTAVMQKGATLFEPILKEYHATLDFKQTHYMLSEDTTFIITEVSDFSKEPTEKGIILALVYVYGNNMLQALALRAPGWYLMKTYPSKGKEWKGAFLDQNGKEVAGFVAMTSPAGAGHSLGVRCQGCLHFHLFGRDWCHTWHFGWGHWASCCH